eukprot:scaffold685_cov281-Pinguiococcus_pyrenoidosus.AAC.9
MVLVQPPKKTSHETMYPCTYGRCAHGSPFASGTIALLWVPKWHALWCLCAPHCAVERSTGSKQAPTTTETTSVSARTSETPSVSAMTSTHRPSNATILARYRALLAFEAVMTVQQMAEMRKEDRWIATKQKYLEKVQCAFREGGLFAHPHDAQNVEVLKTTLSPTAEELDGEKIWALYAKARKQIRLVLLPAFDKTEAQSGKSTEDALKAARLAAYKLTKAGIAASDVPPQYYPMSWLAFVAYRDEPGVRPLRYANVFILRGRCDRRKELENPLD